MNEVWDMDGNRLVMKLNERHDPDGPQWVENLELTKVEGSVRRVFENGRMLELSLLDADDFVIRAFRIDSVGGQCRFTIYESGESRENRLLEWWESRVSEFRGESRYVDDYFDDRTVCRNVEVAVALALEFSKSWRLSEDSMSHFISTWDPLSVEGRRLVAESLSS